MTPAGDALRPVVAAVGLRAEAKIAAGPNIRTVAGGGDAAALAATLEREATAGACAVISFGIAGALSPTLRPGDVVIATAVSVGQARFAADPAWHARLQSAVAGALFGEIAGSDTIVVTAAEKAALWARSGALVVDMESHIAARVAAAHGLPFAALRIVADTAGHSVPPAAKLAMQPGGGIDLFGVLLSLARSPAQLPQLIAIARDARTALRALARCRRSLGDRLGYADLDELALDVV